MTAKTAAIIIGIVFLAVGVLGFIPNPLVSPDGIFAVNSMHNLVHLVSGVVILWGAYGFGAALGLKIIGIVYAIVAILGFFMVGEDQMLLGLIHVNEADKWLHVVLAVVVLAAGFGLPDDEMA
jgi:Domain of unknown function (DUF4383)